MCGSDGRLFRVLVEGAELMLCKNCSRFGKVIEAPKIVIKKESVKPQKPKEEPMELIVENYSDIIRRSREKLGLNQEDFAKMMNEKESVMQKIETGRFEPPIALARKLEKLLKIKLVIGYEDESSVLAGKKTGPVTIGDVIQIKKRKG